MNTEDLLDHLHRTIDALVAIKLDLTCHEAAADHAVVITGATARRACSEIDRAIDEIRAAALTVQASGAS